MRHLGYTAVLAALLGSAATAQDVTLALTNAVNTLDPHQSASVGLDLSVLSHVYPLLIQRGPDMELHPSLATEWEAVDDLIWRFTLVEGAKFANGEPIDADTVAWNIARVTNKDNPTRISSWFTPVTGATAISPTEVEIKTSSPYPALPAQLSMFMLLPPEWAASHDPASETMSGGPYVIDRVNPGDSITMTRNPDYFGQAPAFEHVTFRTIPETSSAIAALVAGEVDYINKIPPSELPRITDSGVATGGAVPSTRSVFIKFNTEKPPMDNKLFRQALNHAVDKDAIVDVLFGGEADVSNCQVMTPAYFGYNPDLKPYAYDPEKAEALIEESGVDLSQPLEFEVPTATYLQGEEVAQAVAQMFADVGVQTEYRAMEFGAYMDKYRKAHDLGQMSLLGQAWPTIDADGLLTLFKPGDQYAYWNDANFGAALEAGNATTDPEARKAAYADAARIMCEEAPVVFMYAQPATYGVSNKVDYTPRGDDWVRAFDMKPAG